VILLCAPAAEAVGLKFVLQLIDARRASITRCRPKLNLDPGGLKLPSHFLSSLDFATSQYDSRASVSNGASRLNAKARVTTCRKAAV